MPYASAEGLLVGAIVVAAALYAAWRLAGPTGRERLMRRAARLLDGLGMHGSARRIEAARARRAALRSGSPCANCAAGPGTQGPGGAPRR